eukprot:1956203-Rhodomonas_salina.1
MEMQTRNAHFSTVFRESVPRILVAWLHTVFHSSLLPFVGAAYRVPRIRTTNSVSLDHGLGSG